MATNGGLLTDSDARELSATIAQLRSRITALERSHESATSFGNGLFIGFPQSPIPAAPRSAPLNPTITAKSGNFVPWRRVDDLALDDMDWNGTAIQRQSWNLEQVEIGDKHLCIVIPDDTRGDWFVVPFGIQQFWTTAPANIDYQTSANITIGSSTYTVHADHFPARNGQKIQITHYPQDDRWVVTWAQLWFKGVANGNISFNSNGNVTIPGGDISASFHVWHGDEDISNGKNVRVSWYLNDELWRIDGADCE